VIPKMRYTAASSQLDRGNENSGPRGQQRNLPQSYLELLVVLVPTLSSSSRHVIIMAPAGKEKESLSSAVSESSFKGMLECVKAFLPGVL